MAKTKTPKAKAPDPKDEPKAQDDADVAKVESADYTVVARRYRPQQFADLIGQEHVANALVNAITSNRIAHAYLFTGARGVGKTSTARILAKALNCVKGPTPTPCDECEICTRIATGDDVDVVEIDGASNNKVDEVRDLRQNVGYRPTHGRYKIYIIDEVHMLTTAAFNALLKTLEEPPAHVKFILATTEVQKIPITILSRCQRFDFSIVGPGKIYETLKHIVKKEGIKADEDALQIVARRANGSMRDSQTLLDQLLSFCEGELSTEKVHTLLGTASDERIKDLADAILNGDASEAVKQVNDAVNHGLQPGELLDQLIDFWRGMMLISVTKPGKDEIDPMLGSSAVRERMSEHAGNKGTDAILAGLDVLSATKSKIRFSTHSVVLMEMCVVRLARLDDLISVSQIAQWLSTNPVNGGLPANPKPAETTTVKKKPLTGVEVTSSPAINHKPVVANEVVSPNKSSKVDYEGLWERVVGELGPILTSQLRDLPILPAIIAPNSLVISVEGGYNSATATVRSERNVEMMAGVLRKLTGKDWQIRFQEVAGKATTREAVPVQTTRQEVSQLPLIRSAIEVFNATLVKVDDDFKPLGVRTEPSLLVDDEGEPAVVATTEMEES